MRTAAFTWRCSGATRKEKDRALGVLKGLHAREIHYWGSWNVEDVPSV